jgi:hypothetical protein
MPIDKIHRYNASVDGETVFLKDSPRGGLINATMLHSALQRRVHELWEEYKVTRANEDCQEIWGRAKELEDIIRALGEEPL